MENWKDINEEEEWAYKVGLVTLFMMYWEAQMLNVMLEFLNTFVIKGTNIYFGYQEKVYVINKQLIVNLFGVYVKGYIEDSNGQVSKSVTLQALHNYRITPTNYARNQWNAKNLGLPYSVTYPTIISMIYQKEKNNLF